MSCLDQFSSCDLIGIGFGRKKGVASEMRLSAVDVAVDVVVSANLCATC